MAEYTLVLDETKQYPHIKVYRQYSDDTLLYWDVRADEGYVMKDIEDDDYITDKDGNKIPVTYYYRRACLPTTYNFDTFSYVAVSEDDVDPDFICGNPNKPETM